MPKCIMGLRDAVTIVSAGAHVRLSKDITHFLMYTETCDTQIIVFKIYIHNRNYTNLIHKIFRERVSVIYDGPFDCFSNRKFLSSGDNLQFSSKSLRTKHSDTAV